MPSQRCQVWDKKLDHKHNKALPLGPVFFSRPLSLRSLTVALDEDFSDVDPVLYEEALRLVFKHGQASTSLLQRQLKTGFGKAMRLLDKMESECIISPSENNVPRKIMPYLDELMKKTS